MSEETLLFQFLFPLDFILPLESVPGKNDQSKREGGGMDNILMGVGVHSQGESGLSSNEKCVNIWTTDSFRINF